MSFNDYLNNAWSIHAADPKKVANEFKSNFNLMNSDDDVMAISRLIVHVCGEHLGNWQQGIELLRKLKNNAPIKDKNEMNRLMAILDLGNNPNISIEKFSQSDKTIIYSTTAAALASLGGLKNAAVLYHKACEINIVEINAEDPANHALAIASNSIACKLEDKKERTQKETELMITAATMARKYWEIAGSWKEVERAEYRLSKTFIEAADLDLAKNHAEKCLEIVIQNKSEPLEVFFAYEALATIQKLKKSAMGFESALFQMKNAFDLLSVDDQNYCQKILETLSAPIPA
jgi:tetratricopeptide (TPR) repeat protein